MGDHRETSIDSRSSVIGCIAQDQLLGKIFCKVWPLPEFEFLN
jgi:signal peptidase I